MSEQTDLDYFAGRAAVERAMSEAAADPNIARIHAQLADRYARLAAGLNQPRPTLHVAAQAEPAGARFLSA